MPKLIIETYEPCSREDEPTDFPPVSVETVPTVLSLQEAVIHFIMSENGSDIANATEIFLDCEMELGADGALYDDGNEFLTRFLLVA